MRQFIYVFGGQMLLLRHVIQPVRFIEAPYTLRIVQNRPAP
ncbi:MAG: hypothetical protein ACI87O_002805 [Planctomycetota bacterium]|jgi:hypothetical protein